MKASVEQFSRSSPSPSAGLAACCWFRFRAIATSHASRDEGLRERLVALAREKPRFGYRRLHVLLGREGEQVNHKRVHRIYREAGLACAGRSGNTACG